MFAVFVGACGFAWFTFGRVLARLTGPRAVLLPRVASVALLMFAALIVSTVGR